MTNAELAAWLGPAADDLTDEQIERVAAEADRLAEQYPHPDDQHKRDAALSAVVQYLLGETTPEQVARELTEARTREACAYAAATAVGVMLHRDGERKAIAARQVGIDRMSLLKTLGER